MANYNYIENINYRITNDYMPSQIARIDAIEPATAPADDTGIESQFQSLLESRANGKFDFNMDHLKVKEDETDEDLVGYKQNLKIAQRFKGLKQKRNAIAKEVAEIREKITSNNDMTIAAVDKITALQNHMSSFIDMTSDGKLMTQEYTAFLNKKTAEYQVQREKKIAELQADMDALDTRLNILRTVIVAALEDTVEPGEILNKKLCAVCFENEVNMAAVPCGHTLCGDCSKSTGLDRVSTNATRARPAFLSHSEQPKCPHCRSQVSSVVKLYFSV